MDKKIAPTSHSCEEKLLDSLIIQQTPTRIYTINKFQDHVLLQAYDSVTIAAGLCAGNFLKLIYKHAISTIEVDQSPNAITIASNGESKQSVGSFHFDSNQLEKLWLDKAITTGCRVILFTTCGFPEKGIILGYDECVIEFIRFRGDSPKIMYKSAISTIVTAEGNSK